MPLVTLHRDGEAALVNTDNTATYEAFISHGWKPADPPDADDAPQVPSAAPKIESAAPKGRKAKQ